MAATLLFASAAMACDKCGCSGKCNGECNCDKGCGCGCQSGGQCNCEKCNK